MSGTHNGVERKAMDIRQLCEEKPKLGWLVDIRFNILHNLRRLDELEPQVAAFLKESGAVKVLTRDKLYDLSSDPQGVRLIIREPAKTDALPYLSSPPAVQLFCNEAKILHNNQQLFWHLTPDEIHQAAAEFQELAKEDGLIVNKGKYLIAVRLKEGRLEFSPYDGP